MKFLRVRVPGNTLVRGQDRPPHDRKAFCEKWSGQAKHTVVGPVPRDVVLARAFRLGFFRLLDFAKANEGVHLVQITRDLLAQPLHQGNIVVQLVTQQVPICLQTPQQPIEQIPALRVTVGAGKLRLFQERFRHEWRRRRCPQRRIIVSGKQVKGLRSRRIPQVDLHRQEACLQTRPRSIAPHAETGLD